MTPEWSDRALMLSPAGITLCTTEAMFENVMRSQHVPKPWPRFIVTDHAHATAHWINEPGMYGPISVTCIHPTLDRDQLEVVGLIVHEAVHVWQRIAAYIGETEPSAEFEAYSVQGIAQTLLGEYRRQVYGAVL